MIPAATRIGARVVIGPAETERRTGQTRVWLRCDCGDVRAVYTHSLVKSSPPLRCARCARRMVSRSRSSSLASTVEIGIGPVPLLSVSPTVVSPSLQAETCSKEQTRCGEYLTEIRPALTRTCQDLTW